MESNEMPSAKWNPMNKERDATTYASIVANFLTKVIHLISTGSNYEQIEYEFRSSIYHYEKLFSILLPNELASLKAQPGAVWVKASERLPEKCGKENSVIVKGLWHGKWPFVGYGYRNFSKDDPRMYYEVWNQSDCNNDVEWLDESATPTAGREDDAVAFLTWVQKNEYYFNTHGGGYWCEYDEKEQETYLCDTNEELYKLFKKEVHP